MSILTVLSTAVSVAIPVVLSGFAVMFFGEWAMFEMKGHH